MIGGQSTENYESLDCLGLYLDEELAALVEVCIGEGWGKRSSHCPMMEIGVFYYFGGSHKLKFIEAK